MKIHSLPSSINLSGVILWQYQNAKRLQKLVSLIQEGTEASSVDLWKKAFYIFDLDKPISNTDPDYQYRMYGLHSLSNLFGLKRPAWTSGGLSQVVSDDTWRRYLKGMIWLMDSDGSCEDINRWLEIIFPDRHSYVVDGNNMTITYRFFPAPESGDEDWELIHVNGFLPHPAGVKAAFSTSNSDAVLGLGIVGTSGSGQDGTTYDGNVKFDRLDNSRFASAQRTDNNGVFRTGGNPIDISLTYYPEAGGFVGWNDDWEAGMYYSNGTWTLGLTYGETDYDLVTVQGNQYTQSLTFDVSAQITQFSSITLNWANQ